MSGGSDGGRRLPEDGANASSYILTGAGSDGGGRLPMDVLRRMDVFIEAMTPPGPDHLRALEQEALADKVPIIRPQTRNILRFFLRMRRPARILEIGTAVGFSTLFLKHYAPAGCRIVTIEKDPARAEKARENFASFASQEGIELLEGDAMEILTGLKEGGSFDFVFLDAAKGQYIRYLPQVLRLLQRGGLLVSDNILQEGEILSSRFVVTRRNRTIHSRMRAYIRALMEEPSLETLLLSEGDGTSVSLKV